jgi:hypothetical protein
VQDDLGVNPAKQFTDPVLTEAYARAKRCIEWRSNADENMLSDYKMRHGDDINQYQWPNSIRRMRDGDGKPCLTLNVIRQHNLMIVNEGRQGKSAMQVRPTGNGATVESAQMFNALLKHIERISAAQTAYTQCRQFQVDCGLGWLRLYTDYAGPDTFDQEVYIGGVNDPLSVHIDPDIKRFDGLDAKFGFVFDKVLRKEFFSAYPKFKHLIGDLPMGLGPTDWVGSDYIRIAEYFRIVNKHDELLSIQMDDGGRRTIRKSFLHPSMHDEIIARPGTRRRDIWDDICEWKLIAGDRIVDETTWPSRYVPLIRCIGEETVIDGEYDCKGHTRAMRDAQRMYNYNASSQVETVAMQGKTPWIAPAAAIEELESYWNTANKINHSVLPYNHIDDDGNLLERPTRAEPPKESSAFELGMTTAFNQMMMTSGQWQNQMGMGGNERTGDAISRRQEQSQTATYHFDDNFEVTLQTLCKQIIDVFPKVYDTKRVLFIVDDMGVSQEVELDPGARQAYLQTIAHDGEVVKRLFNPMLGSYDIADSSGPDTGTQRQESQKAFMLLLTQAKDMAPVIADLLMDTFDFKGAQEAAQRLKRMVPPQALGKGPSPQEAQMEQEIMGLKQALATALTTNAKDKLKLVGKAEMRDIDAYEAETKRMAALKDLASDPEFQQVVQQLIADALATHITAIQQANEDDLQSQTIENPTQPEPA